MPYRPNSLYPYNWNNIRIFRFRKEGYMCRRCGRYSKYNLHLHHIRPVTLGGDHSELNTAPLCSECHRYVHSRFYRGPLIDLRGYKR